MHSPSMEAAESDASAARAAAPPSPSQDKTVELSMPQLAALRRMQSPVKHTGKDTTRPANLAPPRLPSPNMVSSFSPLISIIADSSLEVTPLERHTSQAATPAAALALLRGERHIASPRPRRPLQATTTTTTSTSSSSPSSSSPAGAAATSTVATPSTRSQQGSPRVGGADVALDDEHVTRGVDLQDKAVADVVPSQPRRVATGTTATTGAGATTVSPPRVRASTPCAHTQTRPFTDSPTFAQHRLALLGRSPMPSDLISVTRTLASCSPRSTTTVSSQDHRTRLREGRRTTATNTAIFPLHTPSTATAAPHTARQATTATTTNTTATTNNNTNTTASRVTDPIVSSLLPLHAQARWVYGHHFPLYTEGTATSARVGRDTTSSHHHHHHHHRLVTPAGHTRNEDSEPRKTNHKAGTAAATALNRPDLRRTSGDFLLDRTRASFLIGCQKEEDMHHAGCLPHHLRDGSPTTLRLRGQSLDEVSAACRAAIDLRLHLASRPRVGEGAKDKTAAEATGGQPYIVGHQMANSPPRSDSAGSKKEASYVVLQRAMCAAAADAVRASRSDSDMLLSVGYITLPETELPGQLSWLPPHHFYEDNNAVVDDPTVPIHPPSVVATAVTSATTMKATPDDAAGRQTPNVIDSHIPSPVQQPVGPTSVPSPSHLPPLGGPCALEHARLLHLLSRAGAHLPLARAVATTANAHDATTSNTGHILGSAAAGVVGSGAVRHEEGRLTHNSSRSASHNHQHPRHGSPPSLAESSTTSNHAIARSHLEAHVEPSHATRNASDVASVAESVARSMHRSASAASNTSLVDSLPASHKSSKSHHGGGSIPSPHAAHLPGERGNIAAGGSNTMRYTKQQAPRTAAIRRETNGEDCMPSLGHLLTSFDTTTSGDGTPGVLQGLGLFTAMPLDAQIRYSHSDDGPEGVFLHGFVSASRSRRHRLFSNTHTSHHDGGDGSAHSTVQEQQQRALGNVYTLTAAERGHVAPTPLFSHLMHASSSAAPPEQSQQQVTPSLCQLLDIPGLT